MRQWSVRELRPGARVCEAALDSISTGCGGGIGYGGPHRTDPSVTDMEIAMGSFSNRPGPVADVTLVDHHVPLATGRRVPQAEGRGATP
jgi:hypothetical protein